MNDRDDDREEANEERRAKLVKAGVAVGIGSAAIVAALLYASKIKKKPRREITAARSEQSRIVLRQARDGRFPIDGDRCHLRPYHSSSRISWS
jgi:hypothetical protein